MPLGSATAASAWQLFSLRANLQAVSYPFDASVHEQMVRYATNAFAHGRSPLTGWFPYIGLGSAQFLHYQSLPALVAGLAGTVLGPGNAFRWSLYLLLSLWPLAIYASARLSGLTPAAAAVAACLSPLVASHTGVGFEQGAYLWSGGAEVWAQLWASWVLPFAWATTWRAMRDRRYLGLAVALIALTVALHFETGYLALLGVMVMAFAGPGRLRPRLARAGALFGASLVASAWALVPLVAMSRWASVNEVLAPTSYVRGYGAGQDLAWLFSGQVFDARHTVPAISLAVLAGVVLAIVRWKREPLTRALLVWFAASLALSFGPTTWGPLYNAVPAHSDLFARRFLMGAQLSGLYLAGRGAVAVGGWLARELPVLRRRGRGGPLSRRAGRTALVFTIGGGLALAWPAAHAVARNDNQNGKLISAQASADRAQGAQMAPLIAYIKRHGDGRAYAGSVNNWGRHFTVGYVAVYKYLEMQDVDEATYIVPTASLMLGPQFHFDEQDPSDYALFGVRYLVLPATMQSPVPAQRVMARGPYALWVIPPNSYVDLVEVTGRLSANRADVTSQTGWLLTSSVISHHEDSSVSWPGQPAPRPTGSAIPGGKAPGIVENLNANLARGQLSARVDLHRPGALLLSAAYDPGWHATVDGRRAPVEMLAPAVMGVQLRPGPHQVVFSYHGYRWYPELVALSLLPLAGLWLLGHRGRTGCPGPS